MLYLASSNDRCTRREVNRVLSPDTPPHPFNVSDTLLQGSAATRQPLSNLTSTILHLQTMAAERPVPYYDSGSDDYE
jgi:hypothetical protein